MKTLIIRQLVTLFTCCILLPALGYAQNAKQYDHLYSAGHAGAFIGGLYDVYFPYKQVLQHGDFGLGAPADMDGELLIYKGIAYKTQYTGKTTVVGSGTTPYAISCFFKADNVSKTRTVLNKAALLQYIDSLTNNVNGLYAIHIKGKFTYIKTRAFPPVQKPYKPLSELLANQHFFEFNNVEGDLIGFKLPGFMEGPFIKGYHFHFLKDSKNGGGHIIDLIAQDVTIEIDQLSSYSMDLPQTQGFKNFEFAQDMKEAIKNVETGKKD